jgi:hypothetical protein
MALTQVDANQLNSNVFNVVGPFRNRLINGSMQVAQRGTSATVTAGTAVPTASTGYPTVDRWYVYSTGANVTAAQVSGSGSVRNRLQITGAASVTAVGIGQRIEALNSYDLAGSNVTLSVDLANSLLTTVTWTAYYATSTDTFGTVGTATRTQIATGTFTVSSTVTRYSANIAIPAAATTGIEIVFTVGAQISGTWTVGNVQLETGLVNSTFEQRSYQQELGLCQRYYQKTNAAWIVDTSLLNQAKYHIVTMRTTPTVLGGGAGYSYSGNGEVLVESQTARATASITYSAEVS